MQHYTYIRVNGNEEGWFFFDDDKELTYEDGLEIVNDPLMKPLFTSPAIHLQEGGVVVSTVPSLLLPDKQPKGYEFVVVQDNKIVPVDLYKRFNDCNLMIKYIGGCHVCPDHGLPCFNRMLPKPLNDVVVVLGGPEYHSGGSHPHTLACNTLRTGVAVGKYKFLSPALTKTGHFEYMFRTIHNHDFSKANREYWHNLRSAASKKGAETRRFRKEHCVVCPISNVCNQAKWCRGRYPEEGASVNIILDTWLARLEDSGIKEDFFWKVARSPAMSCNLRHKRRSSYFSGWTWKNDKFVLTGYYNARGETFDLPPEDLEKYVSYKSNYGKRPKDLTTALYFMSLTVKQSPYRQGYGWGHNAPWFVRFRSISEDTLCIGWADKRSPTRVTIINDFNDFHTSMAHRLPGLTQLNVKR